jgi:hypothetical protein
MDSGLLKGLFQQVSRVAIATAALHAETAPGH